MPEFNVTSSSTYPLAKVATYGGIASNIANGLFGIGQTFLNYWAQKKLAEQQNKMQLDWWNMQNEYNHPKQQIKRMVEAGLNPNLAYGNLASSNAGDVGTPSVAGIQFNNDLGNSLVQGLQNTMQLLSFAENIRTQRLQNEKLREEVIFGFPTELTDLSGNLHTFDSRGQWLQFMNRLRAESIFNRNKSQFLQNAYNMRTLDDRIQFMKYSNNLRLRAAESLNLRNKYQSMINDWYVPNQIFNMVNQGIGTLFDKFVMPFIPRKASKIINYNF